jgi:hypothetical protein
MANDKDTKVKAKADEVAGVNATFKDEDDFTSVKTNADLFYKPELSVGSGETITLRGVPLKRNLRPASPKDKDKNDKFYFVIQTTAVTTVFDGDGNPVEAPIGTLVWADERYQMREVGMFLPHQTQSGETGAFEVICRPTEKEDIGGGRTMWRIEVKARRLEKRQVQELGMVKLFDLLSNNSAVETPRLSAAQQPS